MTGRPRLNAEGVVFMAVRGKADKIRPANGRSGEDR